MVIYIFSTIVGTQYFNFTSTLFFSKFFEFSKLTQNFRFFGFIATANTLCEQSSTNVNIYRDPENELTFIGPMTSVVWIKSGRTFSARLPTSLNGDLFSLPLAQITQLFLFDPEKYIPLQQAFLTAHKFSWDI